VALREVGELIAVLLYGEWDNLCVAHSVSEHVDALRGYAGIRGGYQGEEGHKHFFLLPDKERRWLGKR